MASGCHQDITWLLGVHWVVGYVVQTAQIWGTVWKAVWLGKNRSYSVVAACSKKRDWRKGSRTGALEGQRDTEKSELQALACKVSLQEFKRKCYDVCIYLTVHLNVHVLDVSNSSPVGQHWEVWSEDKCCATGSRSLRKNTDLARKNA